MKKLFTLAIMMLMVLTGIFAQNVTTVNFTGEQQNKSYQKLDSVLVTNLTQNWSEVVYYPDTLILLSNVGITDYESRNGNVHLYQNIPNPFHGVTNFNLTLANKEKVDLVIYDISGRKVAEYHNTLPSGEHQFRAAMDIPQTYLLSALTRSGSTSIKMINLSNTGEQSNIELISSLPLAGDFVKKESIHGFKVGDEMQYVGYATQRDGVKSATVKQVQNESEIVTFTFPNEVVAPVVTVTTGDAANIESTTATLSGTYEVKNAEVKETGFEYKVTGAAAFEKIVCTGTASPFTADLNALLAGTEYTYKAYVKTAEDAVYYGEEKTFTTVEVKETVVTTSEATDITITSATFNGSYVSGSEEIKFIGFELKQDKEDAKFETVYSTTKIENPFKFVNEKLDYATKYVYRAFVTTTKGQTYYGNEVVFETVTPVKELPDVITMDANTHPYNDTKAQLSGRVNSTGYCEIKEAGFYIGKTKELQKEGKKLVAPDYKTLECETELLEPSTLYYYMAFAENEVGVAYGNIQEFATRKAGVSPEIKITNVDAYATTATVDCDMVMVLDAEKPVEKGVCYSEKENPTVDDKVVPAADNDVRAFISQISDLKENTTYYVRGYVISFAGIVYSNEMKFTTTSLSKPEVQTVSADRVGSNFAIVTSKLTVSGGSENLVLGVRVFNEELKFDSIYVFAGSLGADGTFETKATKLEQKTKYSAQAYAKNELGEFFGEVKDFTTTESFSCGSTLKDVQNNEYQTVQIGNQCWMKEDLRSTIMSDGTEIKSFEESSAVPNNMGLTPDKLYYYEREDENIGHHVYYPWSTATRMSSNTDNKLTVQGICPDGWHVPSWWEVRELLTYVDPEFKADDKYNENTNLPSENKLGIKLAAPQSESYWYYHAGPGYGAIDKNYNTTPNTPGYNYPDNADPDFNKSGFSAIPNGYINRKDGKFWFNASLNMWTSINNATKAGALKVAMNQTGVVYCTYGSLCNDFYAVRCVMD